MPGSGKEILSLCLPNACIGPCECTGAPLRSSAREGSRKADAAPIAPVAAAGRPGGWTGVRGTVGGGRASVSATDTCRHLYMYVYVYVYVYVYMCIHIQVCVCVCVCVCVPVLQYRNSVHHNRCSRRRWRLRDKNSS